MTAPTALFEKKNKKTQNPPPSYSSAEYEMCYTNFSLVLQIPRYLSQQSLRQVQAFQKC